MINKSEAILSFAFCDLVKYLFKLLLTLETVAFFRFDLIHKLVGFIQGNHTKFKFEVWASKETTRNYKTVSETEFDIVCC